MSYSSIPDEIERFILDKIDSVAHLEALLLLREHPDQEWSAEHLAQRLYISENDTTEILGSLNVQGFLKVRDDKPLFRYRPRTTELKRMVDRLAELYAKQLLPITNLIHSKPKTRVREFADAFRLRKDK